MKSISIEIDDTDVVAYGPGREFLAQAAKNPTTGIWAVYTPYGESAYVATSQADAVARVTSIAHCVFSDVVKVAA